MEKFKIDFKVDIITGEEIPLLEIKKELHNKVGKKNNNYYFSEIADFYYKKKYNKNILEILGDFYDIPKCPITNEYVSYKLNGSIVFGKYSSSCSYLQINKHVCENNDNYKAHIERMKVDRKGSGNPMYGANPWNSGLTKDTDERIKKISDNMMGNVFTEDILKKMSDSAKKREVHGHTGFKHSEESKQIMREKTIARFKAGSFPQTNSLPHIKTREVLEEIIGEINKDFEEEFEYGGYVFDFKVGKNLIEVQGDYFHCNPKTRHATPKNKMQENNIERDKRKSNFVLKEQEYNLIEFWEYDIINNIEIIKECIQNLKK
jgi:hypothetical protein